MSHAELNVMTLFYDLGYLRKPRWRSTATGWEVRFVCHTKPQARRIAAALAAARFAKPLVVDGPRVAVQGKEAVDRIERLWRGVRAAAA